MKIDTATIKNIAAQVQAAARDNAYQSVRENASAGEVADLKERGGLDLHPEFSYYFRATAEMIVDQLMSERHERDHSYYDCPKTLTEKQAAKVRALVFA